MTGMNIKISRIMGIQGHDTQQRIGLNRKTVGDYHEVLKNGGTFPPIEVIEWSDPDGGDSIFYVGDGWHRIEAFRREGKTKIPAQVVKTCPDPRTAEREAIFLACQANKTHGLPRTADDKKKAVLTLLTDSEWSLFADRKIAGLCGVSHTFVAGIRASQLATLPVAPAPEQAPEDVPPPDSPAPAPAPDEPPTAAPPAQESAPKLRTYIRGGKTQTMDVSRIGGGGLKSPLSPAALNRFDDAVADILQTTLTAEDAQRAIRKAADLIGRLRPVAGEKFVRESLAGVIGH